MTVPTMFMLPNRTLPEGVLFVSASTAKPIVSKRRGCAIMPPTSWLTPVSWLANSPDAIARRADRAQLHVTIRLGKLSLTALQSC